MQWFDLEHTLHRDIMQIIGPDLDFSSEGVQKFILLVSGGADSLALLFAFSRVLGVENFARRVEVLHFHHGDLGVSEEVRKFRAQSRDLVQKSTQDLGCSFQVVSYDVSCAGPHAGSRKLTEEQARDFRMTEIQRLLSLPQNRKACFVFGHHRQDLLETRFMRLLRGTGVQGLQAMQVYLFPYFRPWLSVSKDELESYLQMLGQNWMVDPQVDDLRSWLRHQIFPQIEERIPGGLTSMARSLDQMASHFQQNDLTAQILLPDNSLSHPLFLCLSQLQKQQVLARYLQSLGCRDYSRGQIDEILKRLDKSERVHTFQLSGLNWEINAEQIRGLPVPK